MMRVESMTLAELAAKNLLTQLLDLPVGRSVTLKNFKGGGGLGLVVTRHANHITIFEPAKGHSETGPGSARRGEVSQKGNADATL